MTKYISNLIPDYRRPGFNTGYNAAYWDGQEWRLVVLVAEQGAKEQGIVLGGENAR